MPVVWLIDAYREGERAQVRALVQALGWPCETKQLCYRKFDLITHLLPGGSLRGINRASRESLKPPWPDLVVSCGVRNEPVCRWIREQSGGQRAAMYTSADPGPIPRCSIWSSPHRSTVYPIAKTWSATS